MNLTKYFSDLEYNEQPYTFNIAYYGFTPGVILEKAQGCSDEKSALDYLINLRDKMITLNKVLSPHCSSKFVDYSHMIDIIDNQDGPKFKKNAQFEESQKIYEKYLSELDLTKIENKTAQIILEDIKFKNRDTDVLSIKTELDDLIDWTENFIRKIQVVNQFYTDEEMLEEIGISEKIVWSKKKEDFVALFDKLFELGFFVFKKNKYQLLAQHFCWIDEEINPEKLRHLKNNIKNKKETHQISDELKNLKFD